MSNTVTASNSHAILAEEVARLRKATREAIEILTARRNGEAWSKKISQAVPVLREALK